MNFINPDLHMHSVFSDGSDTPEQLVTNVKLAGVDLFALTDHDCYSGCDAVKKVLKPGDPVFLGGVELSCEDEEGKYHILGYCYNSGKPKLFDTIDTTHKIRISKAEKRLEYLESIGYRFTPEETLELLSMANPGKPHFVKLLLKNGYVDDREEAFKIVSGYHGEEQKLTPEEAIEAILDSDGIPVLAHGIFADGSRRLSQEELEKRVKRFKLAGLMGMECYYSSFSEEQKAISLDLAHKYHLLVTAGSDYHGKNKTVRIGETNSPDPTEMERFYRAIETVL